MIKFGEQSIVKKHNETDTSPSFFSGKDNSPLFDLKIQTCSSEFNE